MWDKNIFAYTILFELFFILQFLVLEPFFLRPPYWTKNVSDLPGYYQNEDLMVWMRTAAFPSFRKLYGRILLEENSKLAYRVPSNSTRLRQYQNLLKSFLNKTEILMPNFTINPIAKLRFPKGQYFIDIEYSRLYF